MSKQAIHIWGFYDGDVQRPSDRAAIFEGSVYDAYCTVVANVMHFGGGITNRTTTRDLDGWLRGVEFDVPAHGCADLMWHRICEPSELWPDPTLADRLVETDEREEVVAGHGK